MAEPIERLQHQGPLHVAGLDLGQTSDPTALAVLRRSAMLEGDPPQPARNHRKEPVYRYDCVHLVRYPLGTSYPAIVADVGGLIRAPELNRGDSSRSGRPRLAIDATGVGRPVVDMFIGDRPPCEINPITITGGRDHSREPWPGPTGPTPVVSFKVPKLELVATVQALLSSGRLKIVPTLGLAELLKKELLGFQIKITAAANETFGAWREGAHDDLVLAVALAAWLAETRATTFVPQRMFYPLRR